MEIKQQIVSAGAKFFDPGKKDYQVFVFSV